MKSAVKMWQQTCFISLLGIGIKLQQNQRNYLNIDWKKIIIWKIEG